MLLLRDAALVLISFIRKVPRYDSRNLPREWRTPIEIHVLAWRFAKLSNFAETATFLRQIASDVMSHAQTPAVQLF